MLITYLIALHLLVALLLWKTDFRDRVKRKLGVWVEPEIGEFWNQMVGHHLRVDAQLPPGALLFIGDSHLQGLDVSRFGPEAVNFGLGGDTTRGVHDRLRRYRSLDRARGIVLLVGGNDLRYRGVPEIIAGYQDILAAIPASVPVIAVGLPLVDDSDTSAASKKDRRNATLAALDQGFAAACQRRPLCRFVDSAAAMRGANARPGELHDTDGLHLSAAGYRVIGDAIAAALTKSP